jgi:hypothetical protein
MINKENGRGMPWAISIIVFFGVCSKHINNETNSPLDLPLF